MSDIWQRFVNWKVRQKKSVSCIDMPHMQIQFEALPIPIKKEAHKCINEMLYLQIVHMQMIDSFGSINRVPSDCGQKFQFEFEKK